MMALKYHLKAVPPYLVEVFVRYKAAWGGSSLVIVGAAIYVAITGCSFSRSGWVIVFMLAVIGAQFWHGLMQFEKMRTRFEIRPREQHFWGKREQRGSTGTGYYFEVFNPSVSESLECVRSELVSIEPEPDTMYGILPFPLHIRHLNYCIAETFINPRCSRRFDLATGPDHNVDPQRIIVIPGIIGGDRGYGANGVQIPYGRYRLNIRVSARHCAAEDISFEVWVENDDFLRCEEHRKD